jgi:hypothetical protein
MYKMSFSVYLVKSTNTLYKECNIITISKITVYYNDFFFHYQKSDLIVLLL